jgi:hypothetical protein
VVELLVQLVVVLNFLGPSAVEMGGLVLRLESLPVEVPGFDILTRGLPDQCRLIDIWHIFIAAEPLGTLVVLDDRGPPMLLPLHFFVFESVQLVLKLLYILVPGGLGTASIVKRFLRKIQVDGLKISELILSLRLLIVHAEGDARPSVLLLRPWWLVALNLIILGHPRLISWLHLLLLVRIPAIFIILWLLLIIHC